MSVLIVEDEPLIRMELVEDAARAGLDVLDAPDAESALALLAGHDEIRVMLTDIDMPGRINGIELARRVSAARPAVAVILTSAGERPAPGALPPGGRFVPKPYDLARLIGLLCDVAAGAPSRARTT